MTTSSGIRGQSGRKGDPPKHTLAPNRDRTGEKSASLVDRMFEWFESYVSDNDIRIGDALPTEAEIVEATQFSRTSVREGLTRLRGLGVIDTRRKRGMRLVRSVALLDLVRLLSSDRISPELMGHVASFRSALEMGLGPEVFRLATPKDVDKLRRIYEQMIEEAGNPDVWPTLDSQFHYTLVKVTGNRIAIWFHELLEPFFRAYSPKDYPVPTQTLERHRQIVETLADRDPYGFDHALREHHLKKLRLKAQDQD